MALYAKAGFALFPLNKDRSPKTKGWNKLTAQPEYNVDLFRYGYGIVLRDSDFVLDYDPRNGKGDLKRLINHLSIETPIQTYMVTTGRDGCHVYFSQEPNDSRFPKDFKHHGFPGVEIKRKGHYIIGPGSPHDEGGDYFVSRGSLDDIIQVESALTEFALAEGTHSAKQLSSHASGGVAIVADDEITRGRFRKYCETTPEAIEQAGGDITTWAVAASGRRMGLPLESTYDIMVDYYNPRCCPPWDLDDLMTKVVNAYTYSQDQQGSGHPHAHYGKPSDLEIVKKNDDLKYDMLNKTTFAPTQHNLLNLFRLEPWGDKQYPLWQLVKLNLLTNKIEFSRPAPWHTDKVKPQFWTDLDAKRFKAWIGQREPFTPSVSVIEEAIPVAASWNAYHPIRDWLATLRWDGVARLDEMLINYAGTADSPYTREISKNTMIALVDRALNPGCQHDEMLILEGKQGIGKSSFVRILGGPWYKDVQIDPHNKDTAGNMQGGWILEASELEFMKRTEIGALKRFLSLVTDSIRLPYDKHCSELPRQSGFIGTVNPTPDGYLKDGTGNRRFLPVYCTGFDLPALRQDREQLFAEAMYRHLAGEKHHMTDPALLAMAVREQRSRMETDSWTATVEKWLATSKNDEPVTTEVLAYQALNLSPKTFTQFEKRRISAIMREIGYEQQKRYCKISKDRVRQWVKEPQVSEEAESWI